MTDLDLDAMAARAQAASGQRWIFDGDELTIVHESGGTQTLLAYPKLVWPEFKPSFRYVEDGIFIEHARQDVPTLIAAHRDLAARLADATQPYWDHPPMCTADTPAPIPRYTLVGQDRDPRSAWHHPDAQPSERHKDTLECPHCQQLMYTGEPEHVKLRRALADAERERDEWRSIALGCQRDWRKQLRALTAAQGEVSRLRTLADAVHAWRAAVSDADFRDATDTLTTDDERQIDAVIRAVFAAHDALLAARPAPEGIAAPPDATVEDR